MKTHQYCIKCWTVSDSSEKGFSWSGLSGWIYICFKSVLGVFTPMFFFYEASPYPDIILILNMLEVTWCKQALV